MFVLFNYVLPLDGSVKSEKHKEAEILQHNFDSNEVRAYIRLLIREILFFLILR